jgi:hypothetical protein
VGNLRAREYRLIADLMPHILYRKASCVKGIIIPSSYYWDGLPPKPLEGVEVNTGGVPCSR